MGQIDLNLAPERKVLSVSELSQTIKQLLERNFPDVWVEGEVSNFRPAPSGHLYFTLKDESAQLKAVCFRNTARYLKFRPEDGLAVVVRGRVGIYEVRGEYQIYVEHIEPAGLGAFQLAFEQLKARLAQEGLFDPDRKKPLPVLPRTVGMITSPRGAVVRDMLRVLGRRFANMGVLIYPVRVQGEGSAEEIVEAIQYINRARSADVLVLARGGGSMEDLWSFNEEGVARAIAASRIPVISAVGHETDFTISDFVADLRAPTPSVAAELVVRPKREMAEEIRNQSSRLRRLLQIAIQDARQHLTELRLHPVFQTLGARITERAQQVDEDVDRLALLLRRKVQRAREALLLRAARVRHFDFRQFLELRHLRLVRSVSHAITLFDRTLASRRNRLINVGSVLRERNPMEILKRGYSITHDTSGRILRDAGEVETGSEIRVRLARGRLGATVSEKES